MKKREIIINGRFLTQQVTGVQRVAIEFINSLDKLLEEKEYSQFSFTILIPDMQIFTVLNLSNIKIKKTGFLKGHVWEQIWLPIVTLSNPLINLCGPAPIFKLNQIVTIHDASVYTNKDNFSKIFRVWYRAMFQSFTYFSRQVVTVSNFSKRELIKFCGYRDTKITSIHLGVDHFDQQFPDESILKKHNIKTGNYILAVSSKSPNKNFNSIINALDKLKNNNYQCVIVGGANNNVFRNEELKSNNIKYLGYVSDSELKALYKNAGCFIYPSFYEGFGLPPIEAMSCGCPVIVSNVASLPEVCGDSAVYCDPYDVDDISKKIDLIMNDSLLREKLKNKGLQHSQQYRWSSFSDEFHGEIIRCFI